MKGSSVGEFLRRAATAFARAYNLFPCPLCGDGDGDGRNRICPRCRGKLHLIAGERCRGCGGALDGALAQCSACLAEKQRPWQQALSLFEYKDAAREAIHRFKFGDFPMLAAPLGEMSAEELARQAWPIDWIVPIPLHWRRQLRRTYNQSELLAREIGRHLNHPVVNALIRCRHTRPQSSLDHLRRRTGPANAFQVKSGCDPTGKRILLVDDVFTTGATLAAAAKTLQKAHCGPIFVFTLARAVHF